MTRQEIEKEIKNIFRREFEVENPDMDVNLREAYGFDSIDRHRTFTGNRKIPGLRAYTGRKKTGNRHPHHQPDL